MKHTIPTSFTIDRARWIRGGSGRNLMVDSVLLNTRGQSCCLGFFAVACGAKAVGGMNYLVKKSRYNDGMDRDYLMSELPFENAELLKLANHVNDSRTLSNEEIEEKVAAFFAAKGITVDFIN